MLPLVVVLLFLLPLQLWAGQIMPVLQGHAEQAAASAHSMPPCHGEVSPAAHDGSGHGDASGSASHGACDQCQLCHAGALPWALPALAAPPTAHAWQAAAVAVHHGTALDSAFKPPIS